MSKLNCPCGWQISNVGSPNDWTGVIVNDHQRDEHFEDRLEDFDMSLKGIWECTQCGRLAIDRTASGREVVWFKPVTGEYEAVLRHNDFT